MKTEKIDLAKTNYYLNYMDISKNNIPPEQLYRQPGAFEHGKKNWFALHHLVAYALFGMLALAAIAGIYYYQVLQSVPVEQTVVHHPKNDKAYCIQVITAAINPKTGEEKEFPTPCDVPAGWTVVETGMK